MVIGLVVDKVVRPPRRESFSTMIETSWVFGIHDRFDAFVLLYTASARHDMSPRRTSYRILPIAKIALPRFNLNLTFTSRHPFQQLHLLLSFYLTIF